MSHQQRLSTCREFNLSDISDIVAIGYALNEICHYYPKTQLNSFFIMSMTKARFLYIIQRASSEQ